MTNNDDFDIDDDVPHEHGEASGNGNGNGGNGGGDLPPEKPSLREVWDNNPLLKVAAIVLAGAVALGGYFILGSSKSSETKSIMRVGDEAAAKQVPGQQELDPAYRKALEEQNRQIAENAAQTGGSALPTPIGTAKQGGLDVPAMPEQMKSDPLTEWRKAAENHDSNARRGGVACADDDLSGKSDTDVAALASQKMMINALLAESKRRAVRTGGTAEAELHKMLTERGEPNTMIEEARRAAATDGLNFDQELSKMASTEAVLDDAQRHVGAGSTLDAELAKMAATNPAAHALTDEATRRAAANATTLTVELAKMAEQKTALDEAQRRVAKNGTTAEEELSKMAAEKGLLDEAKRRGVKNSTSMEQELIKMAGELGADDAKRKLIDDMIRNMTTASNATPVPEQPQMQPPVRPQQAAANVGMMPAQAHVDPKNVQNLEEQMRVIIAAQAPMPAQHVVATNAPSAYAQQQKEQFDAKTNANGGATAANTGISAGTAAPAADVDPGKVIIPAGNISYGQLLNELNSDINGPVLVQILSGPFAGGRAIGKVETKTDFVDYMVLTFNRIVKDDVSYAVNGIALDEKTTLAGQATDVDHHYMVRVLLPAAAKFMEGYSSALSQTGTTVTQTSGGGQAVAQPVPSPKQSVYEGASEASRSLSQMFDRQAARPETVVIAKGTTMGIFFIDTVTTKDAGK